MRKIPINYVQAMFVASSSFLPLQYYFIPRVAVHDAGYYSIWSVVGACLVGIFTAWVHSKLNQCFPGMTGVDLMVQLYGRWLGRLLSAVYIPGYILFLNLAMYYFTHIIKIFLPRTPESAIALCMIAVSLAGAYYGLETLARTAFVIFALTFFGNLTTMMFLVFQDKMPRGSVVYALGNVHGVSLGIYHLLPMFFGFSIVLMLNPHQSRTSYPNVAMLLNVILIVENFVATILVLGYEATEKLKYTFPFVLMLLRLNAFIIERIGISVVILATSFTLIFLSNHMWAISQLSAQVFGNHPEHYQKYLLPVTGVLIIAILGMNPSTDELMLNQILAPLSWGVLLGIPLISLVYAKMKGFPKAASPHAERQTA